MYQIKKNTISCSNVFRIFLNFLHGIKKGRFDIRFGVFLSEVQPGNTLQTSSLPSVLLLLRPPEGGRSPAGCGPQCSAALSKFQ
jgi:hypothetical protein